MCVWEREREKESLSRRAFVLACLALYKDKRAGAREEARKGGREREREILSHLAFFLGTFSCLALYKDRGSVEERVGERVRGRHAGRESFSE